MFLRIVTSCLFVPLLCAFSSDGFAQTASEAASTPTAAEVSTDDIPLSADVRDMETIAVVGRYPGPGLWKVRNGEHTLWILGTLSPLPKRMEWDSANVERRVSEAQEVLMPPTVKMDADVGFFSGLTLLPSLFKARKNPDGKTLHDVLPAAQYARWQVLKKRYIGSDSGIETWRPVFAAAELYDEAIKRSDMTQDAVVSAAVRKAAKRGKVKITTPMMTIKIADPKTALREFANEALDDQECFRRTLDWVDTGLGAMASRANAWAEGDIQTLRELPYENQSAACNAAFSGAEFARKHGVKDIQTTLEAKWLAAVDASLAQNTVTFALLPMSQLLRPDGLLKRLAAKGYVIEEP